MPRRSPLAVAGETDLHTESGRRKTTSGVSRLGSKIVQGAVAEVLNAVYEADFRDCSSAFGPCGAQTTRHAAAPIIAVSFRQAHVVLLPRARKALRRSPRPHPKTPGSPQA